MKKRVFALILLFLMLTGCGGDPMSSRADHKPPESSALSGEAGLQETLPQMQSAEGITLKAEPYEYPRDVSKITLLAANDTDADYCLPERFSLMYVSEVECELVAAPVPYKEGGDYFTELAQVIPAHGTAEITLDLAAHYDLPLGNYDCDFFRVMIGDIAADFRLADNAPEPEAKAEIQLDTELERYPAAAEEITVRIINTGTQDFTFDNAQFYIEQFFEGSVAVTRYEGQAAESGQTLAPDDCIMWTLRLSDFHNLKPEPGEYAVCLAGNEARFTVTE